MAKVYEFIANGTEEIEALTVVDVLRRAGADIKTVSITGSNEAVLSHGVKIECDTTIEQADLSDADMLLLPGGLPGATNLNEHDGVRKAMLNQYNSGKSPSATVRCSSSTAMPTTSSRWFSLSQTVFLRSLHCCTS